MNAGVLQRTESRYPFSRKCSKNQRKGIPMYTRILVPIDLGEAELAKPAIAAALMMANQTGAAIRLVNVLPLTPAMLAEYVPADFETQQRKASEEALGIICNEIGL